MKRSNDKRSKQKYAYNMMRNRILNGTYGPGYKINISQLAKEFSTSAIPIREALRQLEAENLIDYKQFSGAVVTPVDEGQYVENLTVLAVLMGYATALSTQRFPPKQIKGLISLNDAMKEALEEFDFNQFGKLNRDFHELSYRYCDNKYLLKKIEGTENRIDSIRRTGSTFFGVRARESVEEHEVLLSLFKEKASFEKVEKFVKQHVLNTVEAYKERKKKLTASNNL